MKAMINTLLAVTLSAALFSAPLAANNQQGAGADKAKPATHGALQAGQNNASKVISSWPKASKDVAQKMIKQYGEPRGVTPDMLVWEGNGPWAETVLRREPIDHNFPVPHKDVLAQTIYLEVPADKFDELARYDGSVFVERTRGTISARCDKEAANFLALNLAHDIISDERSVEEARDYYAKAIERMMENGEKDRYMEGLTFETLTAARAGDPDERSHLIAMGDDSSE